MEVTSESAPLQHKDIAIVYGVIRHVDKDGRKSWAVSVRRHGMQVRRSFHDEMWGGEQKAFDMAVAYRKELIAVLPPMTRRGIHTKLKKNNTSGISGVHRIVSNGLEYWVGSLDRGIIKKRGSFRVDQYGEQKAKELAIAFRKQALAEVEQRFVTFDPVATETTDTKLHSKLADDTVSVLHRPLIDKIELEAKVAEINTRYDALIPSRLSVYLKISPKHGDLVLANITGGVRGTRCKGRRVQTWGFKRQPFSDALSKARTFIENAITGFYDAETAKRFMADYATSLSEVEFDRRQGFCVNMAVPWWL